MKNKKLIIAVIALVAVMAILLGIYFATRPGGVLGPKTITVTVVHKDESVKNFTYTTEEKFLGQVLLDSGLVEGEMGQYGLFIESVDGEAAVWETDGAFWIVYVGEESAITGADQIPLTHGGEYKLVYTVG